MKEVSANEIKDYCKSLGYSYEKLCEIMSESELDSLKEDARCHINNIPMLDGELVSNPAKYWKAALDND